MPDNAPTKNIAQRALSWLRGDDIGQRKGMFPYEENPWLYNGQSMRWGPTVPSTPNPYTYGTHVNYEVAAGDLVDNTAVMACLLWVCRTFPEAPLIVKQLQPDGEEKEVQRHAMAQKVRRPNPYYSGMLLWQATLLSFNWNGNAYWRKIRNGAGQVLQLYYEPHWNMRPVRSNGDDFITRYEIWRDREWKPLDLEDVVHFRYGIDPRNDMLGMSPLASALREVFTDNQAARYASAMFRNKGVLGGMVWPDSPDATIDNPEQLKAALAAMSTGDNVGSWGVFTEKLGVYSPDFDPSKMDTRGNRKITEERISALLGVPAIVAGLGAGLDRSTFANMAEAREAAYEGNIIPTQAMFADELDIQLLPDFSTQPDNERTDWDYSKVRVLQDDENKKAEKWSTLYTAGLVKRSAALADLGLPYDATDEVYRLSPLLEVALLNQGRVAPAVLDAVTVAGELMPGADQGMPQAASTDTQASDVVKRLLIDHETGIVKSATNGHIPALREKAKPKQTRAQIEAQIVRDVKAEIERVYDEAASNV